MASTSTLAAGSNSEISAGASTLMPLSSTSASPITNIASNNKDYSEYIPLHRAIMRCDWDEAQKIFSKDKDALTVELAFGGRSALHVAIAVAAGTRKSNDFIENLLNIMDSKSLPTVLTSSKYNPLHRAAVVGNIKAAKMLVDKNPNLLFIRDNKGSLPIHRAVYNAQKDICVFLLDACKKNILLSTEDGYESPFEGKTGAKLLNNMITSGFIDVAYELVKDYPHLARIKDGGFAPLEAIARKWDAYPSGMEYNFYERFVYHYVPLKRNLGYANKNQDVENQETYNDKFAAKGCIRNCLYSVIQRVYVTIWDVVLLHVMHIKRLQEEKMNHERALLLLKCVCEEVGKLNTLTEIRAHYLSSLVLAVKNDTREAVEEITNYFPRAFCVISDDYNLCQVAIMHRCVDVLNFLVHKASHAVYVDICATDKENSNLLHLAAKLPPAHKLNVISGAALQMQRELQWFQAVESIVPLMLKEKKNDKKETPIMVFRKEHNDLRKDGEEWMKKTADSYTITAALIITIVFAAAITVPGGTDGDNGKPIYSLRPSFIIFAVSDAISLFTSTTSLLLFLSILTARYREEDFLYRLPKRLILGLVMLFLSVTSMMVAFSATFYIMFGRGKAWVVIPIGALTCLPIASFVTLQLPLLLDLYLSTYGHGILGKQGNRQSVHQKTS